MNPIITILIATITFVVGFGVGRLVERRKLERAMTIETISREGRHLISYQMDLVQSTSSMLKVLTNIQQTSYSEAEDIIISDIAKIYRRWKTAGAETRTSYIETVIGEIDVIARDIPKLQAAISG